MAALVHTAVRPAGYRRKQRNKGIYFDAFEIAKRNLRHFRMLFLFAENCLEPSTT
jgi:hypothetical protein